MYIKKITQMLFLVALCPFFLQSCDKVPTPTPSTVSNEFKDTPWLNIEMKFAEPRPLYMPPLLPIPINATVGTLPVQPASYIPDPASNVDIHLYKGAYTNVTQIPVASSTSTLSNVESLNILNNDVKYPDGDYTVVVRYPIAHQIIRNAVPSVRIPNTTAGTVSIPVAPPFSQTAAQGFTVQFWGVGEYQTFTVSDSFAADLPVTFPAVPVTPNDFSVREKQIKINKKGNSFTITR